MSMEEVNRAHFGIVCFICGVLCFAPQAAGRPRSFQGLLLLVSWGRPIHRSLRICLVAQCC